MPPSDLGFQGIFRFRTRVITARKTGPGESLSGPPEVGVVGLSAEASVRRDLPFEIEALRSFAGGVALWSRLAPESRLGYLNERQKFEF